MPTCSWFWKQQCVILHVLHQTSYRVERTRHFSLRWEIVTSFHRRRCRCPYSGNGTGFGTESPGCWRVSWRENSLLHCSDSHKQPLEGRRRNTLNPTKITFCNGFAIHSQKKCSLHFQISFVETGRTKWTAQYQTGITTKIFMNCSS